MRKHILKGGGWLGHSPYVRPMSKSYTAVKQTIVSSPTAETLCEWKDLALLKSNQYVKSASPADAAETKQMLFKGALAAKLNILMTFWSFLVDHTNCQHSEVFTSTHSVPTHSGGPFCLLLTTSQFTYTAVILDNQVSPPWRVCLTVEADAARLALIPELNHVY